MQNSKTCSKCGSYNIKFLESRPDYLSKCISGLEVKSINVGTLLCRNCGFIENWLSPSKLEFVRYCRNLYSDKK